MNILVTGGAGYIGSVLVPYLVSKGHSVQVVDKLLYGGEGLLGVLSDVDFRNLGLAFDHVDMKGIDAVVHLAAIVGEPACKKNEWDARNINYLGAGQLAKKANKVGVPCFLFASTCSNYGVADLATEDTELNPLGLYAETKVAAERDVLEAGYTALRFATVFGLSPRMRFDTIVNQFARDAAIGKAFEVYSPEATRPLIHVIDIARAIHLFIEHPEPLAHQIYNVGGFNTTKLELVEMVAAYKPSWDVKLYFGKGRRDYAVDFHRIQQDIGFNCCVTVEEGIDEVYNAVKDGFFVDPCDPKWRNA